MAVYVCLYKIPMHRVRRPTVYDRILHYNYTGNAIACWLHPACTKLN